MKWFPPFNSKDDRDKKELIAMTSEVQNRIAPVQACSRAGEEKRTADWRGCLGHIFLGGFKGWLSPSFFCLLFISLNTANAFDCSVSIDGGINYTGVKISHPDTIPSGTTSASYNNEYMIRPLVGAEASVGGQLRARLGLYWSSKGFNESYSEQGTTNHTESTVLKADYLEVPVLVEFAPRICGSRFSFFADAGIAPAVLVNAEAKYSSKTLLSFDYSYKYYVYDSTHQTVGVKKNLGRTDLGLVLGGGAGVKIGPGRFFISARYTYGIFDIEKNYSGYAGYKRALVCSSIRNRTMSITAGYEFFFGERKTSANNSQQKSD